MDSAVKTHGGESMEEVKFSEKTPFNFGALFTWASFFVSLGAVFVFWTANRNVVSVLDEKRAEKKEIITQIQSAKYLEVEKDVNGFNQAVTILDKAVAKRYSYTDFLPEFYKKVTNDVQIKSVNISTDGVLSFDGVTSSYRQVADLMMSMKSWPIAVKVTLDSVSEDVDDKGNTEAEFSMTVNFDSSLPLVDQTATTESTESDSSGIGDSVDDSSIESSSFEDVQTNMVEF